MQRLLFAGDYPDPSIIRVGEVFYITHSSFSYHPGLLIWESRDLCEWKPVGFAVDQPGWSIWAPDLVHHDGRFYIYYFARSTSDPPRGTNWVVHAPSVAGPWSEPVEIDCSRIDPGHAVGLDGQRYLHFSSGYAASLSGDGMSLMGQPVAVYGGWEYPNDWRVEGHHIEGPKVLRRGSWFYLVSAQGGTAGPATSHMAVVARSRNPIGPWENSPYNPLVHTYSRHDKWWSTGHASLIDGTDGEWHAVFHGYLAGYHTLGRQTLISSVQWESGWPVINDRRPDDRSRSSVSARVGCESDHASDAPLAPLELSDHFEGNVLGPQWRRFDRLGNDLVSVLDSELRIACSGSPETLPPPLVCAPADPAYRVEVTLDRLSLCDSDQSGLLLYYDNRCFAGLLLDGEGRLRLAREGVITRRVLARTSLERARVMIANDHNEVEFYLHETPGWRRLDAALDVSGYNHNVFGGFLSLRVGLIGIGKGTAAFRDFRYLGSSGGCGPAPES